MTVEQAKQLLNVGLAREANNEDGLTVVDQAIVTWLNDLERRVTVLESGKMALNSILDHALAHGREG